MWGHLYFPSARSESERAGCASHHGGTTTLCTNPRMRGHMSLKMDANGRVFTISQQDPTVWPRGSNQSLLLVQRTEDGQPRFAFVAHTRKDMWLALDIYNETPAYDDAIVTRILLHNIYGSFATARYDGGDASASGWWTCPDEECVHHEARHYHDENAETLKLYVAGIAGSIEVGYALPAYTESVGM
jgi:hypothetical protein